MLADGNGDFTRAVGLELDASKFGMGKRSQRYSMVVDNGVVKSLNVEEPGAFEVSSAEYLLQLWPAVRNQAREWHRAPVGPPVHFPDGRNGRHPAPVDLVAGHVVVQRPPQIFVLDRLLVGGLPALVFPALTAISSPRPSHSGSRCGS